MTADVGVGSLWEDSLIGDAERVVCSDVSVAESTGYPLLRKSDRGEEGRGDD